MDILTDKKLANYVTMRLGGPAAVIVAVKSEQDIAKAVSFAKSQHLPIITLGSGSNIIFRDSGFHGLVIINKIPGLSLDQTSGLMQIGSGVIWNDVVQQAVSANLSGVEALALIPGTVGAAPVNNIGAYGQEIKDSLISLKAFDAESDQFVEITNTECDFSYRHSRFKNQEHGRFVICQINLQLCPTQAEYQPPNYPSLLSELKRQNIIHPTVCDVQQVVANIRRNRLPDPDRLASTGSFFKNPIANTATVSRLLKDYPAMPYFPLPDGIAKLAAGWLIEAAGLKNYRQSGIWVYDKQALVLINESARSFNDLWLMAEHIIKTVNEKFGVILETEPEII
jgi:UDP-N-acetylmuramate dehydrogenase